MKITITNGDFGQQIPINLWTRTTNTQLAASELNGAAFNLITYRRDSSSFILSATETEIYPRNKRLIDYYRAGQSIRIGNELMQVTSVDYVAKKIVVTRGSGGTIAVDHPKGALIIHIVSESATAVDFDGSLNSAVFTPESGLVLGPGLYAMEIEVDTTASKHYSIQESSPYIRYELNVLSDANGG